MIDFEWNYIDIHPVDLADKGAKGEQCKIGRYTQTQSTGETNITGKEKQTADSNTENTNKQREDIRKIHNQRLINMRILEKDKIQIHKPVYGHGSNIRSKFAFGKVFKEQAKSNTAKHNKLIQEQIQNKNLTDTHIHQKKKKNHRNTQKHL